MGNFSSSMWSWWFGRRQIRLLMLGLDGAGKTTVLYKLKLGEVISTIPTIGFNVETVDYQNISFTVWDVGGQQKIRSLWHYYFQNTQGLIFVVDSSDTERFDEAAEELRRILTQHLLSDSKVLILANKQDMCGSVDASTIKHSLRLGGVKTHEWFVQPCSARTGEGLLEGLEWLHKALSKR